MSRLNLKQEEGKTKEGADAYIGKRMQSRMWKEIGKGDDERGDECDKGGLACRFLGCGL